jgi:hypothetical protein
VQEARTVLVSQLQMQEVCADERRASAGESIARADVVSEAATKRQQKARPVGNGFWTGFGEGRLRILDE